MILTVVRAGLHNDCKDFTFRPFLILLNLTKLGRDEVVKPQITEIGMRIQGITIPDNKRLVIGLTTLHGVGVSRSREILNKIGIDPNTKVKDITTEQENIIRDSLKDYTLEGDLKREKAGNIKRLKDIGSYRGMRHSRNLPVRGQRTKTNSRTAHGNKRNTMGSGKKKVEKK